MSTRASSCNSRVFMCPVRHCCACRRTSASGRASLNARVSHHSARGKAACTARRYSEVSTLPRLALKRCASIDAQHEYGAGRKMSGTSGAMSPPDSAATSSFSISASCETYVVTFRCASAQAPKPATTRAATGLAFPARWRSLAKDLLNPPGPNPVMVTSTNRDLLKPPAPSVALVTPMPM